MNQRQATDLSFAECVEQAKRAFEDVPPFPKRLLALDPGGTTGWAYFEQLHLVEAGQIVGTHIGIQDLILHYAPEVLVMEDYKIYPWKAKQHNFSGGETIRLIGAVEALAASNPGRLRLVLQMAHVGKSFCKDDKLRRWGLYQNGQRHANDAVRHGAHYLLFEHRKLGKRRPKEHEQDLAISR